MDIPVELAERKQWIVWRNERGRKIPYQPTGRHAKSNDPATWYSLAECQAVVDQYSGLGFVFSADDPFCGIDLDNVLNDGELAQWAEKLLAALPSYAEVSPSSNGIKLWIRGQIPDGKGRKHIVSDGQQVEVYDRGRYFAFTGQTLDAGQNTVNDCQVVLDAMLARFWPTPEAPAPLTSAAPPPDDVIGRALAYVATIPGVEGGAGRDNETMRVAANLIRGFEMSVQDALPVIREWNSRCSPNTWTDAKRDKALLRKLRAAKKHPGPTGWLLNGTCEPSDLGVDLSGILAGGDGGDNEDHLENDDLRDSDLISDFPSELLRPAGLLAEIMDYTLETSKYPQPEIALAGAIALMSVLTGRKVCDDMDTRTNLYLLTVNPARSGKDRPREVNKEILYLANGQELVGPERIGSHAGLVAWVEKSPSILFQIDELGRLLATTRNAARSPHLYAIPTVLLSLYSSATNVWIADAYADVKRTKTIDQPHCVIFGTTTGETLWPNLSTENIEDGLMGRLLVFEGRGYVDFNEDFRKPPVPSGILQAANWWVQFLPGEKTGNLAGFHPVPQMVPHSEEARAMFLAHVKEINQRRKTENSFRAAVWSGTAEKTAKLALIHACSRARAAPEEVTVEDIIWGKHLANLLTRKVLVRCSDELSENEVEAKSKRVLKIVGDRKWSRSELTRKLQWIRPRERQEVLHDLVSCGLLREDTENTSGRPRTWYARPR